MRKWRISESSGKGVKDLWGHFSDGIYDAFDHSPNIRSWHGMRTRMLLNISHNVSQRRHFMNQISWKDENAQALSSCYVSRKSSIRREVLDIVVQPSFGCWWGCDADPKVFFSFWIRHHLFYWVVNIHSLFIYSNVVTVQDKISDSRTFYFANCADLSVRGDTAPGRRQSMRLSGGGDCRSIVERLHGALHYRREVHSDHSIGMVRAGEWWDGSGWLANAW